jgi:hypothetical protein
MTGVRGRMVVIRLWYQQHNLNSPLSLLAVDGEKCGELLGLRKCVLPLWQVPRFTGLSIYSFWSLIMAESALLSQRMPCYPLQHDPIQLAKA